MITSARDIPLSEAKPIVQVYAILNSTNQYEEVGTGTLQIISDPYIIQTQHYIEVSTEDGKELILRSRVRGQNNYKRQKNAIICWEDKEQKLSEDLAMSFEKVEECDIYWKLICEKIGKNYLEINGTETLQLPAQHNLPYIFDKTRNSYNLIAFHITNSNNFIQALAAVFFTFQTSHDQMGTGIIMRIIQEILSHCDHKVVASLLSRENFPFMLELYKENTDIDFPAYFKEKLKIKELLCFSPEVENAIHMFHHLVFFRDFMIDLSKDIYIEQMLNVWIRETEVGILNNIAQEKMIEKVGKMCEVQNNIFPVREDEIVNFLFEIIGMVKLAQSDSIKSRLVQQFYSSGVLKKLEKMLKKNNQKVLSIFEFICIHSETQFLLYYKNEKRENESLNLNDVICKEYTSNPDPSFASAIIAFLRVLLWEIEDKHEFLYFFKANFLFPIFSYSQFHLRNLRLMLLALEKVNKFSYVYDIVEKTKFFHKLRLTERTDKKILLELFKIVKFTFLIMKKNQAQKNMQQLQIENKFHEDFIGSGLFTFCLTYLKKNSHRNSVLASIMLENMVLLSEMKPNQYTKVVQGFNFQSEKTAFQPLMGYLSKINSKQKLESPQSTREEIESNGKKKRINYFLFEDQHSDEYDDYHEGIENGRNNQMEARNRRKSECLRQESKMILKEKELNYEISSEMEAEDNN